MAGDLLGIGEATAELSKGVMSLLQALLGPAADEAGQMLADQVKYRRCKTLLATIEKVEKMLVDKGITPRQIPLKTLIPIMEGMSVEDESENLKAKWVNLISNAAAGKSIHPKYIKLFSELNGTDAVILDTAFCLHNSNGDNPIRQYFQSTKVMRQKPEQTEPLFDYPESYRGNLAVFCMVEYLKDIKGQELDYETVSESFRYLEQLNLIENDLDPNYTGTKYYIQPRPTTLGLGFLRTVSEPGKAN